MLSVRPAPRDVCHASCPTRTAALFGGTEKSAGVNRRAPRYATTDFDSTGSGTVPARHWFLWQLRCRRTFPVARRAIPGGRNAEPQTPSLRSQSALLRRACDKLPRRTITPGSPRKRSLSAPKAASRPVWVSTRHRPRFFVWASPGRQGDPTSQPAKHALEYPYCRTAGYY